MYKTAVYTLVNGSISRNNTSKQQKIIKGDIDCITLTVSALLAKTEQAEYALKETKT